jgi:hypothetical protein
MAIPIGNKFAIILASILLIAGTTITAALAVLTSSVRIQSSGTLKAVNVSVYWDSGCTNATTTINWGILSPNTSKTATLYVRNDGNAVVNLTLTTQSWSPANASNYIGLNWNKEKTLVNPGSNVTAVLTLSVSSNITGITNFTFDIVITGTEQT